MAFHKQWVDHLAHRWPHSGPEIQKHLKKISIEAQHRIPDLESVGIKLNISEKFLYIGPKILFLPNQSPVPFDRFELIYVSDILKRSDITSSYNDLGN